MLQSSKSTCQSLYLQFKVVSVNVRGLADRNKRIQVFDFYRFNADFLCMQETHSIDTKEIENIWRNEWGGGAIFSHGTGSARGVAIFYKKEFQNCIKNIECDQEGRSILIDIHIDTSVMSMAVIYAPNRDTPEYFEGIRQKLKSRSEKKVIVGDFNLTLKVDIDRKDSYCNNNKSKTVLEDIMEEYQLKDVWRERNPDQREYSWIKRNVKLEKASRIDYALVSAGIDQHIENIMYFSSIKSDHRALFLAIELVNTERGKGYWKLNTELLSNREYVTMMNEELQKTCQLSSHKNPTERWELIKTRIRKSTAKYCNKKNCENKVVIAQLSEIINSLEQRLPLMEEEYELLDRTKIELEEKMEEKARGIMFRSKVRWHELGEKNTKYFYSLEKARYNQKTCFAIYNEEGQIVEEKDKVLEVQKNFYEKLYSRDEDVEFRMENCFGIKVPSVIQELQEKQITPEDLAEAVKRMSNKKTPGEDGIPVDFYKVFWKLLKQPLHEVLLYSYENRKLHQTGRMGILNLIPKQNKDTRHVKNLRPITLLNTDYKIVEKAIADKMQPALEHIINQDQRGFMKNRRISVNIRKMLDIISHAKSEDLEAIILSLDFVKCFDKCSFSILHGSLEFFGFGEIVRQWTKILYKDFKVKIQNNGHFSTEIKINKGVHQGGCCSATYFLIIAEILALSIRGNEEIEGITIQDIKNILNQFADDADIFSLAEERSIKQIFEELEKFRLQSGFTLSYEKTTLYRIGSLRFSNAQMYNIDQVTWSKEDINVLGVIVAHENIVEKNYRDIIEKAKRTLSSWKNRGLSLIGKIQVINTLVASLFVYKMMVLPSIPKDVIKNLDNIFREYIWDGKKSKIAYKILQNPKSQGGLNLVNLNVKEKSLKATWPRILKDEKDYSEIVYRIINTDIGEHIWRCNIEKKDIPQLGIKESFWEDVLSAWSEYNYRRQNRVENQIIWYNSDIKIAEKMIYWRDVYKRGLIYVHQLYEDRQMINEKKLYELFGIDTLRLNGLKTAIPKYMKQFLEEREKLTYMPVPSSNYDLLLNESNPARHVYSELNGDILLLHNKMLKWMQELRMDEFNLSQYCKSISRMYVTTNVTKYRSFQYRLTQARADN